MDWRDRATVTETYRRACSCKDATASGPRPIIDHQGGASCTVTWARFACDECDTPWEKVEERHEPPQEPDHD